MSEEKKYSYSSVDIEKYHKGLLSPKEMNELEKAALDDPFLADALEGYGKMPVNISSDMEELEKKLEERMNRGKVIPISSSFNVYRFLKVAAVVIFVSGAAFLVYKLAFEKPENSMAIQVTPHNSSQTPVATDTNNHGTVAIGIDKTATGNAKGTDLKIDQQSAAKNDSTQLSTSGNFVTVTDAAGKSEANEKVSKEFTVTSGLFSRVAQDTLKNPQVYKQITKDPGNVDYVYSDKKAPLQERKVKQAQPVAVNAATEASPGKINSESENKYLNDRVMEGYTKTNFFRGRVTDNNNNALPFANISNVKDNVGTYADAQGNFTLVSSDSVLNVRVKSVGFVTDTLLLQGNLSDNKVVLREDKVEGLVLSGRRQGEIASPQQNIQIEESEPADGWNNYNIYVANNIKIPEEIKQKTLHEEVKLSFEINNLGEPVNIKVEKSNCKQCDEEAIRLLKEGPKWKPKKKRSRVTLTIPF